MNENNNKTEPEPLSAIFAEMRDKRIICIEDADVTRCLLRNLADRIEAAVDRMRDAYCDLCKEKDEAYDRLLLERDKAIKVNNSNATLSAPQRNCDVGTPEKQRVRFVTWCENHNLECEDCPLRAFRNSGDCGFAWMQMPFQPPGQ